MSDYYAKAEHNHVLCRLIDWSSVFGPDAGSPAFSSDVKLFIPEDQTLGHRDRAVVLEVLTCGPGNVSRGTLNECQVKNGDLVVANLYHKGFAFSVANTGDVCTFAWEHLMLKLLVNDRDKSIDAEPLQAFLVCRRNETRAKEILQGNSSIIRPYGDATASGDPTIDEKGRRKDAPKVAIEEVVSVGPGCVIDGVFQVPSQQPGDMVLYDTQVAPLQFRLQGVAYTLVHFRHTVLTFRDTRMAGDEHGAPPGGPVH